MTNWDEFREAVSGAAPTFKDSDMSMGFNALSVAASDENLSGVQAAMYALSSQQAARFRGAVVDDALDQLATQSLMLPKKAEEKSEVGLSQTEAGAGSYEATAASLEALADAGLVSLSGMPAFIKAKMGGSEKEEESEESGDLSKKTLAQLKAMEAALMKDGGSDKKRLAEVRAAIKAMKG